MILINGGITRDGEKLRAEIMSSSSFRFVRFSTRVNIMTSFDVQVCISKYELLLEYFQCSIYWRAKTTETPATTTTTTTTVTTTTTIADTFIMVILSSLSDSYIINGDGSHRSGVQITSPNDYNDYTHDMVSAFVAGQLYLFGGKNVDSRKVNLFLFLKL